MWADWTVWKVWAAMTACIYLMMASLNSWKIRFCDHITMQLTCFLHCMHSVNFSYEISLEMSDYRAELDLFNEALIEIIYAISTQWM